MIRVIRANFAHAKYLFGLRMALDNTRPEDCELSNPEVQAVFFADTLNMLLDQHGQLVFMAFDENVPVGYVSLIARDMIGRHSNTGLSITGLYINKSHRGGMVLRSMFRTAWDYVNNTGWSRIQTAVYVDNQSMRQYLTKKGWTIKAVIFERDPYGQRDSRPSNVEEVHKAGSQHTQGRLLSVPGRPPVHAATGHSPKPA